MFAFSRVTFARQFLLTSFLTLLAGMVVIGLWIGWQIKIGVINRTAGVTALYVDSFIAPHLQGLTDSSQLDSEQLKALDVLLSGTPLGERIVAFKIWGADGRILYSNNPELIGRKFPIKQELILAFTGQVHTEISNLSEPENEYERQHWPRLIETYAPVRLEKVGSIVAVSEFYQTTDELEREILAAQRRSWLVVGAATLTMYLLLVGLVGRASRTLTNQQDELRDHVARLTTVLEQNRQLHQRVRRAAANTTALNERFLHRTSVDLHDGPAQDLALALLRVESLAESCQDCQQAVANRPVGSTRSAGDDFRTVQAALQSALADLRAITAGLRLPELDDLSLVATAERAVREFERKTGHLVTLTLGDLPENAPLPVKITLYRLLQESLANGFRHANPSEQQVKLAHIDEHLVVNVSDNGHGFDPHATRGNGHLGLAGMRERVEILGGTFAVESELGRGTNVSARLPLAIPELNDV